VSDVDSWVKVAGNPAADRWLTRTGCRTVLVVVPHMTAATRLGDVLPLLEADHRVQVLVTVPSTENMWPDTERVVRQWGYVVVPWHQVLRTRFDLALASSYNEIDKLAAPVLVVPHGSGGGRSRRSPWTTAQTHLQVQPRDVLMRDGRVVPAAVVVAQEQDARRLRDGCPEAANRIVIAGDPCYDRILASMRFRDLYRDALDVRPDQQVVMLSSTWSRYSLFGGDPGFWARALTELPADRYRVVAALHPNIWAVHGRRQVLAWLAEHRRAGLGVVPPEEGWRALLVSADYLIGDHGSVTRYGGALGLPTLLTTASERDVPEDSAAWTMRQTCPAFDATQPIERQLARAAAGHRPENAAALAETITATPGQSAVTLRATMYRLLNLPEPARGVPVSPVPLPTLVERYRTEWETPC
jgi:hypothetical protein